MLKTEQTKNRFIFDRRIEMAFDVGRAEMNEIVAFGIPAILVIPILVTLFLFSQWNVRKCSQCGELLIYRMSSRHGDRWVYEKFGLEEMT